MIKIIKIPSILNLLLLCCSLMTMETSLSQSETGLPFLKNYSVNEYKAHTQNFSAVQDQRGVMYFANFSGILEYDGARWRLIPTDKRTMVSTLAIDKNGRIFVGTRGEIGYLQPDSTGNLRFKSLSNRLKDSLDIFLDIKYSYSNSKGVYFIGDNFILNYNNGQIETIKSDYYIKSAFVVYNKLIIDLESKGLHYLDGDSIVTFRNGNYFPGATQINSMLPIGDENILIGTANQGLYVLDKTDITPLVTEADPYFKENQITCGTILSDGTYAFGTYRKGIVIVYPNGNLKQIINKSGGLQNENVKHLFIDRENNLWAALNNGVTLIESPSPLSYYDEKSGLKGGVTKILRHNNSLYVTTYQGLFYYDKQSYSFRQIPGIYTSCWSVIPFNDMLITASSQGIFKVEGYRAEEITEEFSLSLCQSYDDPLKIFVGLTDGFMILEYRKGDWYTMNPKYKISGEIREMIDDKKGNLWLNTSSSGIIKYDLNEDKEPYYFNETNGIPHLIGNNISEVNGDIYVSSFETINKFDYETSIFKAVNIFKKDTSFYNQWIYEIVEDQNGNLWTNSGDEKGICFFNKKNEYYEEYRTPFLPIEDFVAWTIQPEDNGLTWFGGPDGLIRYDSKVSKEYEFPFISLIRTARTTNDSVLFYGAFANALDIPDTTQNDFLIPVLDHHNNIIRFDFASLSFNFKDIHLYQYNLVGFDKIWSDWTTSSSKEYTNLPKGTYIFRLRSKNIFNRIGSEASFKFVVKPAWYNTVVAYVLYILLAGFLVYLIVRMRSRQLVKEKKALEGVIKERTSEIVQQKEEIEKKSQDLAYKNDELEKITQVVRAINSEIHFENLLNTMLEKTRVIKGVEKATALIKEKDEDKFKYKASFGWDIERLENISLTLDEAEERYLKYSDEIFEDIFFKKKFKAVHNHEVLDNLEKPKSMIIVVIKVENKVEGFMILENMNKEDAFDANDFSFLKNSKEHLISAFIKTKILQDLQNTLNNLKETQTQLVQSEKLASLGQLTAGIAHEIQNPLNFVNNFSSLSIDLANELKEYVEKEKEKIDKDNLMDIEEVIEMIESNVSKINEHGKRAERIVKGMLQHSRGSSGEFEEAELNNLVTEYVNLAYHGMRAKDKSFNTAINTDLDPAIGKVKVVPQDFSRVILNIINNGCYAVDLKKKKIPEGYSPEVKVSTKKIGNKIEVRIRDNGTGMPQEVIDKIFNPFFTTKPTGQGTGLGLSMSYDIITQIHKGKIEVKSEDGEYTEFIITIPDNL